MNRAWNRSPSNAFTEEQILKLNFFSLGKKAPRKIPPESFPLGKCPPGKLLPGEMPQPKQKFCLFFIAVDILLQLFIFKIFIVTSFESVSRTPTTSIMDLLVTLINGINLCYKKLCFRCCGSLRFAFEFTRWDFSKVFTNQK